MNKKLIGPDSIRELKGALMERRREEVRKEIESIPDCDLKEVMLTVYRAAKDGQTDTLFCFGRDAGCKEASWSTADKLQGLGYRTKCFQDYANENPEGMYCDYHHVRVFW